MSDKPQTFEDLVLEKYKEWFLRQDFKQPKKFEAPCGMAFLWGATAGAQSRDGEISLLELNLDRLNNRFEEIQDELSTAQKRIEELNKALLEDHRKVQQLTLFSRMPVLGDGYEGHLKYEPDCSVCRLLALEGGK